MEPSVSPDRVYGDWVTRELGADWIEVEPGIFRPAADFAPPEDDTQPESLDEALRGALPEREDSAAEADDRAATVQPAPRPRSRRGWFRRV